MMEQLFIPFNKVLLWIYMWEMNFGKISQFKVTYSQVRFVDTHAVPAVTVLAPLQERRRDTSYRLWGQLTSVPQFGRDLYWSSTKAPHSAWLQVQIGFPLCSCSTLHLHNVQTSGFNVSGVDFKFNSFLCLSASKYVQSNLSRVCYFSFLNLFLILHS